MNSSKVSSMTLMESRTSNGAISSSCLSPSAVSLTLVATCGSETSSSWLQNFSCAVSELQPAASQTEADKTARTRRDKKRLKPPQPFA